MKEEGNRSRTGQRDKLGSHEVKLWSLKQGRDTLAGVSHWRWVTLRETDSSRGSSVAEASLRGCEWAALCQQLGQQDFRRGDLGGIIVQDTQLLWTSLS